MKRKAVRILLGLGLVFLVTFTVDLTRIMRSEQPIFMIEIARGNEFTGYTNHYYGLGYWGSGQQRIANGEMINYRFYVFEIEFIVHHG